MKFEDALAKRLQLIKPSLNDIRNCLCRYPPALSDGIQELIMTLEKKEICVFLISGGFRLVRKYLFVLFYRFSPPNR